MSRKLKILIVTQYFWPENFKINDLANDLSERGHDVSVLTGIPNYPQGTYFDGYSLSKNRQEKFGNVSVVRAAVSPRGTNNRLKLAFNFLSFIIFGSIRSISLPNDFDLIFVYEPSPITVGIPAIIKKWMTKTPIVFWVTDLWPESVTATLHLSPIVSKFLEILLTPLVKFIYYNCDKLLITSQSFAPSIARINKSAVDIEYFPQWAEEHFQPRPKNIQGIAGLPKNAFTIMFAGNVGEAQDFPSIVKAAVELRNTKRLHWIILGEGRKYEWLKGEINKLGLSDNFHLLGRYPLEAMPDFYSRADAMLMTLDSSEIFSLTVPAKLQGYMASGKPIVGMVNGEPARIIADAKAGVTARSGDALGLARIIREIMDKPQYELGLMGDNALAYCDTYFNRQKLFERLDSILADAAK